MSCGTVSNTLIVSGAGTVDANGTYQKVSAGYWVQAGGTHVLLLFGSVWYFYTDAAVSLYNVSEENFPCGPWSVDAGDSPAPTFNYSGMSATSSQTLYTEAKCFACIPGVTAFQTLEIAMLARTIQQLDPMAATSPQDLMDYSECYVCLSGVTQGEAIVLALLDQISQNISGGGGLTNLFGSGSPVGVVTPDGEGQFYTEQPGDLLWQATGLTDTDWIQIT